MTNLNDVAKLNEELERLRRENDLLKTKTKTNGGITIKLSQKGCMSIYFGSRWPISLYRNQAEKLYSDETVAAVRKFLDENKDKMPTKEKEAA